MISKKITDLSSKEARGFFMNSKHYINFDIPDYFDFTDLLDKTSLLIKNKSIKDVCKKSKGKPDYPSNYENVNYTFLSNKDGAFAWRPLQLIHPVLYVDLVNTITDKNYWEYIVDKFKEFSNSRVECISIPRQSDITSHKSSQVNHWWEKMEQRSIKLALDYDYVFTTDITNCYGSIYTHSIEWALNGKQLAKGNKRGKLNKNLGAMIDEKIRNMNYGQTNGIPQGSVLTDFIAEIILGYGDMELTKILKREKIKDFHILRYRDDYRIFTNNPVEGNQILKYLNEVLYNLGMKMNPSKTSESNDIISSSVKLEKMERFFISPQKQNYKEEALRIYQLSKKYPNAGLIMKELNNYFQNLKVEESILEDEIEIEDLFSELESEPGEPFSKSDVEVLIAVFLMIALNSPNSISWVSAIISVLLAKIKYQKDRIKIVKKIHSKFEKVPNTSLADIWLQRISAPLDIKIDYKDDLTKLALKKIKNTDLWGSAWLEKKIVDDINLIEISDLKSSIEEQTLSPVISNDEVELFTIIYHG